MFVCTSSHKWCEKCATLKVFMVLELHVSHNLYWSFFFLSSFFSFSVLWLIHLQRSLLNLLALCTYIPQMGVHLSLLKNYWEQVTTEAAMNDLRNMLDWKSSWYQSCIFLTICINPFSSYLLSFLFLYYGWFICNVHYLNLLALCTYIPRMGVHLSLLKNYWEQVTTKAGERLLK